MIRAFRPSEIDLVLRPLVDDVRTGSKVLGTVDSLEAGVWEHTVGTSTDIEVDEVFVVVSGRATVTCDDGTVIELEPGAVGLLESGARTTWVVHETLRKVYVVAR
jgi:uncharacterized cupin superfamily protein